MSQIEQRLAEIEARHKAANESDDTMAWTEFEERAYTDIPRLVAALRVAVDWITEDEVLDRIESALKGDAA